MESSAIPSYSDDISEKNTPKTSARKHNWQSPGFVSGIAANCSIAVSTIRFFRLPYGFGLYWDDWFLFFVLPVSLLSFAGVLLSLRDINRRREEGKNVALNVVGLIANLCPLGLALFLLNLAFDLRGLWDDG